MVNNLEAALKHLDTGRWSGGLANLCLAVVDAFRAYDSEPEKPNTAVRLADLEVGLAQVEAHLHLNPATGETQEGKGMAIQCPKCKMNRLYSNVDGKTAQFCGGCGYEFKYNPDG